MANLKPNCEELVTFPAQLSSISYLAGPLTDVRQCEAGSTACVWVQNHVGVLQSSLMPLCYWTVCPLHPNSWSAMSCDLPLDQWDWKERKNTLAFGFNVMEKALSVQRQACKTFFNLL